MLENMRRQGASIFIYLIFCLLILIFVVNFGPQGGQGGGCGAADSGVVSIDGVDQSQSSYKIAYSNSYNDGRGKARVHKALELLIRRELLAQEAEARGLRVTDDLVMEHIKKGHFFLGGYRVPIPGIFDEHGHWNLRAFKGWLGQLNVTRTSYVEEQRRGMLAALMQSMLLESVDVSREEALTSYLFENHTVQYDVVAFRPEAYRSAMRLTDADVERFLATHGDQVEERYKADERTYKGVKPQLQLRQILIATGETMKPEAAKAKLEAARTQIAAGKQKFADAARALNTDEAAKASGGELGWRTAESPMLGDKAVSDAVKELKAGEMTPVIETERGVYLVIAEAAREGDLTFDQVKHELARELARDVWGKEAAKRAALSALDKARTGVGLNLDQLYEQEAAPAGPGFDLQQILNDPNLTDEQKQQLLQMLLQQQQDKSGSLVIESNDQPASWRAQAGGASGEAPAEAKQAPPPDEPPAPATDAPAPPAADAPAPPVPTEVVASADQLPQLGEVAKPKVRRHGPAPRSFPMAGLGSSRDAATALFEELSPGMLATRVYEADGAFIVMQLITRSEPDVERFEQDAARLTEEARQSRAVAFVEDWLKTRCEALHKDKKIKPNMGLLQESDDKGNPLPISYRPCISFR
jgi:hypothetical protein